MDSIETIKEQLLVASEEQAESLRAYLAEEEAKRRGEELLNQRLRRKIERREDFCI